MNRRARVAAASIAWLIAAPAFADPTASACPVSRIESPPPDADAEVARRSAALAAARLTGDVPARLAHYAPDSVTMADYQPRLYGPIQAERFYTMLAARQRVSAFDQTPEERIALGEDVLERGTFRIAYAPAAGGPERHYQGRYMNLWRRQPDGSFRLKAETWGYLARVEDPASHMLGEAPMAGRAAPAGDPAVGLELDALDAAEAHAVRTHNTARIDLYAPDAIVIPYADPTMTRIGQIRPQLTGYIERGRGATFDSVRTWNEGYEVRGPYVIVYSMFEVRWRAGADSRVVSGGGLRVWRREPDCSLKTIRQIGTHDHR